MKLKKIRENYVAKNKFNLCLFLLKVFKPLSKEKRWTFFELTQN